LVGGKLIPEMGEIKPPFVFVAVSNAKDAVPAHFCVFLAVGGVHDQAFLRLPGHRQAHPSTLA